MAWIKKHKILIIVLAVVLALLIAMIGLVWQKFSLINFGDSGETVDGPIDESDVLTEDDMAGLEEKDPPAPPSGDIAGESNIFNVLLIGTDDYSEAFNKNARSDSMILFSVNKKTGEMRMVSLERGMGVPVLAGQYEGNYDWLTHIFRYGGAELLMQTVRTCFKVEVDHYVRVNFNAVRKGIDAIGGIDMNLTAAEAEYMRTWHPDCVTGYNRLDGAKALDYARCRRIDSDWKRVGRQRAGIQAALAEFKNSTLAELNTLMDDVLPLVQTNLTVKEMAELMAVAPQIISSSDTAQQMTIPAKGTYGSMKGLGGRSLYAVDFEENARILHAFLYEGKTAEEAVIKPTATTTTTTTTTAKP